MTYPYIAHVQGSPPHSADKFLEAPENPDYLLVMEGEQDSCMGDHTSPHTRPIDLTRFLDRTDDGRTHILHSRDHLRDPRKNMRTAPCPKCKAEESPQICG